MTLRDLENGDMFYHKNDSGKKKKRFVVYGNPEFNMRHGSATRNCRIAFVGTTVSKSCRLEVIKCGESLYKDKIMKLFSQS